MTLRVTLEIVPFGQEDHKYKIGQLDIFNKGTAAAPDGTALGGYSEYGIIEIDHEKNSGGLHDGTVMHRRWNGPWVLVEEAIGRVIDHHRDSIER